MPDAPEEPAADPRPTGELSAAAIREVWPEIMIAVGRKSKKIAALAQGATVRDLDGQTVVLTFRFPAHAKMVAAEPALISDALYEALGGRWQIRCDVAGEAGPSQGTAMSGRGGVGGQVGGGQTGVGQADGGQGVASRTAPSQGGPNRAGSEPGEGGPNRAGSEPGQGGSNRAGSESGQGGSNRAGAEPSWPGQDGPGQAARLHNAAPAQPRSGRGPASARREPSPQAMPADDGDDWPEPARLGGNDIPEPVSPGGDDWPEPARPGGTASPSDRSDDTIAASGAARASADDARSGTDRATAAAVDPRLDVGRGLARDDSGGTADRTTAPGHGTGGPAGAGGDDGRGGPAPKSGLAAARAAAANAGRSNATGATSTTGAATPATGAAAAGAAPKDSWSDGSTAAEEPPYDPDFDGPVGGAAAFEGFDPGDEPLDDVIDEKVARQSSEQQAMQLLQEAFGAEKISEI
jgi:DNA polymerase-3 subunit gamma/tau